MNGASHVEVFGRQLIVAGTSARHCCIKCCLTFELEYTSSTRLWPCVHIVLVRYAFRVHSLFNVIMP